MDAKIAVLVYGGPGAGKTRFGASSFWDFKQHRQIRNGRLLYFGTEDNPAITAELPPELVKRFELDFDPTRALEWATSFRQYMIQVISARGTDKAVEVLVFDGFSEWNQMFQLGFDSKNPNSDDKFAKWDAVLREYRKTMQLLKPSTCGATIIATARVGQVKKALTKRDGTQITDGDPDWMQNYRFFPDLQGRSKQDFGHFFSIMSYVEADTVMGTLPGQRVVRRLPVHNFYMLPTDDFYIKNAWEDKWVVADMPEYLTNPTFDSMMGSIDKAIAVSSGETATTVAK